MTMTDEAPVLLHDDGTPTRPRRRRRPRLWWFAVAAVLCLTVAVLAALRQTPPAAGPAPAKPGLVVIPPTAGATRTVAGIPVGYPHTKAGAVAAATNFIQVFGHPDFLNADARHTALRAIAAPGRGETLISQIDPGMQRVVDNLGYAGSLDTAAGRIVIRDFPLGWRADGYTADRAVISVWSASIFGVAGVRSQFPVQTSYGTDTVELVWSGGDWKWGTLLANADGPAPVGGSQTPASPEEIAAADATFTPYSYGGLG